MLIIHLTLKVTPEHSRQMSSPISLVLEVKIWIYTFLMFQKIDDCLSITTGECLQLIVLVEIAQTLCCKSNLIIATVPL
jgi:hypothetical protein